MSIQIPDDLVPAQVGGYVSEAQYIKDGNKTQHEINEEMVSDAPTDDGMYVRKNGQWYPIIIAYDEPNETLIIDTRGEINNNNE